MIPRFRDGTPVLCIVRGKKGVVLSTYRNLQGEVKCIFQDSETLEEYATFERNLKAEKRIPPLALSKA